MRSIFALATASLATLAFLAVPARGDTADTLERTFTVSPGGSLRVDVDFGAVEVTAGAGNEVTLEAQRRVRGRSAEVERKFLAERPILASQEGDRILVTARRTGRGFWNPGMKVKEARFLLRVPARFDVQIDTAGGHIFVSEITGAVAAHTSGGELKFSRIQGPVDGRTSGGGITLSACQGDARASTSGGPIQIVDGGGAVKASTSGGGIEVRDFNGPARVETSGGGLNIENVGGEVSGSTSGGSIHATLRQPVSGPVRLVTSGGGVTLKVAPDSAFELDAATSGGDCRSEIGLSRQTSNPKDANSLRGVFGTGGPKVILRSSGGGIRVVPAEKVSVPRLN